MAPRSFRALVAVPGLTLAPAVAGQEFTYDIFVSNSISPAQPSATIEVWAAFDPSLYAFAGTMFDLAAAPDSGGFSDPTLVLSGPGTQPGEVSPDGDTVEGIIAGQLQFVPPIEWLDLSNPILLWKVTWSTDDFTPRNVSLATHASKFDVYIDKTGTSDSFLDQLVEGAGVVHVVPAPGAALLLASIGLPRQRRLRR